jgi:DegV family protein with EDD domain
MAKYQIIADATADFPLELAVSLEVDNIPMDVIFDDDEVYSYVPGGGTIGVEEFYQMMREGKVAHTSQINPLVYTEHFEKYLAEGQDIIYIGISSALSATIEGAYLVRQQLQESYPDRKIYVIDSLCASVGEALLVYTATKKQQAGLSVDELAAWIENNKLKLCHWFTVDDLEYLKRGGRLSAAAAALATTLNIKPVLHVDNSGHLVNVKKVRGRRKSFSGMVEEMEQTYLASMGDSVFIGHGSCRDEADLLAQMVKDSFPMVDVHIYDIGPVVGAHAGPGVLALFFWGEKR